MTRGRQLAGQVLSGGLLVLGLRNQSKNDRQWTFSLPELCSDVVSRVTDAYLRVPLLPTLPVISFSLMVFLLLMSDHED